MSVQAGIWNFDGRPVDPELLESLNESLKQQGPDGKSFYVDRSVALLYRPFHTTPESRQEKQPYTSRRGFILTWDGRLDNRDELNAELRSSQGAGSTDICIVAAAFDQWGTACFPRIIGDWALTIWKPVERELIFALDYMAIRHIFYYLKKDQIWWATGLASLVLISRDKFHIDNDYIAGYFAHDPDAHLTPYREIREVPPGQFMTVRDGAPSFERYWRFNSKSRIHYKADAEYEEHFRHLFRQSVRHRLRSDSPVLAELSGGLDSSSIVCMADDILVGEGTTIPQLDTISYYDKTEPYGDDWLYFPKVEQQRGRTGHHIDASEVGKTLSLVEWPEFQSLPGSFGGGLDLESECAAVVRNGGYRVVLSGLGGDEFMGGIPDPSAQLADLLVQFKWLNLIRQSAAWSLAKRQPIIQVLWHALVHLLPHAVREHLSTNTRPEPWIETRFAKHTRLHDKLAAINTPVCAFRPSLSWNIRDVFLMANKTAKMNVAIPAHAEIRYPYLDQPLVEFILAIPATQILRPGDRRSLMRRSLARLLPKEVLSRKTKQFGARSHILRVERSLTSLHSLFSSSLTSKMGFINDESFLQHLDSVKTGTAIHIVQILRAIALELWMRNVAGRGLLSGNGATKS